MILRVSYFSQILKSIVARISIDVIQYILRPASGVIRPNKMMG